jgi:hypothetical protein
MSNETFQPNVNRYKKAEKPPQLEDHAGCKNRLRVSLLTNSIELPPYVKEIPLAPPREGQICPGHF